jgi:hypothetical protein
LRARLDTLNRAMEGLERGPAVAAPLPPDLDWAVGEAMAGRDVERLQAIFIAHPEARLAAGA